MPVAELRLSDVAGASPYHVALVPLGFRSRRTLVHTHLDYYETFYVLGGAGRHWLPDCARPLRGGDLVLVRDRDQHAFSGSPPGGLQLINVAVATELWRGFGELAQLSHDDESAAGPLLVPLADGDDMHRAEVTFRRAMSRYAARPTRLDAIRFLSELAAILQLGDPDEAHREEPEWLQRACSAMRQEEHLRAGLPRLLELSAVSHAHLARTMRRYRGLTPVEFVTHMRVRYATVLLMTTDLPVALIATRIGFASAAYFSHCFRAVQHTSPRAFRTLARRRVVP